MRYYVAQQRVVRAAVDQAQDAWRQLDGPATGTAHGAARDSKNPAVVIKLDLPRFIAAVKAGTFSA